MDDSRDVQISTRKRGSKPMLMSNSAVAMEIKRNKIRESSLHLQTEDTSLQEKLEFEMRMREGAYKLLLACSKREQILNASKNLLTSNARIKAYLSLLQSEKEQQGAKGAGKRRAKPAPSGRVPCHGTVAVSGLRIPLLWSDSEHFNNRGTSRRVAIFCLLKSGSEVFDTEMVVLDKSITDICFEGVTLFKGAVPQFELRVELWSCAVEEELTLVNTPKKLAKKFRNSFGKGSGKKVCSLLDNPDPDTFLQINPIPAGAKFSLLAHTTLALPEADGSFQSHSLIVLQDAEWSSWLPLYGNLCCQLLAQPDCMTHDVFSGYMSHKEMVEGMRRCSRLFCVLRAASLCCYYFPEEVEAKVNPCLTVPITKETHIYVTEKESAGHRSRSLSIVNPSSGESRSEVFTTDTNEDLDAWLDALLQHTYNQNKWMHSCERLMKIAATSPRKPSLFLTKKADSVYNELSINSPAKFESITDIIHNKIEETDGGFLIGSDDRQEAPNWSSLFAGSQPMVVEKGVLSQSKTSTPRCSPKPDPGSTPISAKKRRAPPPPYKSPPAAPARPAKPPPPPPPAHRHAALPNQEKENSGARATARSKTGRPSLDAKFSAIIQQLQRNNAAGAASLRKHAPLGILDVQPQSQAPSQQQDNQNPEVTTGQHTFVRACSAASAPGGKKRKSFKERMDIIATQL